MGRARLTRPAHWMVPGGTGGRRQGGGNGIVRCVVLVLSVVSLFAVECGRSAPGPPVKLAGTTNNHGTKKAKDDLAVKVDDYSFTPTFLSATAGQTFTIALTNDGGARHTFTSEAMGVDLELPPGAKRTVTVAAPPSGFSEFHCRYHQSQGMQGAVYVK